MEGLNPEVAKYFIQQQRGGALPVYVGARHQRGHGLGNILAGGLRYVTPILKHVGRSALTKVPYIVTQTLGGKPLKDTLKNVAVSEGKKLIGNALVRMTLDPFAAARNARNKKRKASTTPHRPAKARKQTRRVVSHKGAKSRGRKRRKTAAQDIFD